MALTPDDLAAWFAEGAKPRAAFRIGTEHEKIGFRREDLRPLPYEDGEASIRRVLEELARATDGALVHEDGRPVGLMAEGAAVTLEPGGQLELSGAPVATVHETCAEVQRHLHLLSGIGPRLGTGFLTLGYQPLWRREEIPWMPKARYRVMREWMPRVGRRGLDMMLRTAGSQVNLDFADEEDMRRKVRVAACLQPVVTALFAASPFEEGRPSGFLSTRAAVWLDTDPARTGLPACFWKKDFGFRDWAEFVLDVPMYFVAREGRLVPCPGASFRDFLAGRLSVLPGERPTLADWELHVSTVFTDLRIKRFLELRGADAGPWDWICSLPAFWKGILYDDAALEAAFAWVSDWRREEVVRLQREVPRRALAARLRGRTVRALAERALSLAEEGLLRQGATNARGEDERIYLRPLWAVVREGRTQAERWLASFHGEWEGDVRRVFDEAVHA